MDEETRRQRKSVDRELHKSQLRHININVIGTFKFIII